ncbi:MAG: 4'-phosphopantetheinyl transferase [Candidatus Sedimenticola sp. (ex Thyasira tokunagai)]
MEPTITTTWNSPHPFPSTPGGGELHLWLIDLSQPEAVEQVAAMLAVDEQERSRRIRLPSEQRRFILARAAMRSILSSYLGIPAKEITFQYGEKGKPTIDFPRQPVEFNLSHAKDTALLAVSGSTVGIDLEPLAERKGLRRIAPRVFSAEIVEILQPLQGEAFTFAFFQHWTELEAKVKAAGEGIFSETGPLATIRHRHFQPTNGWLAAVAMEGEIPPHEKWSSFRFSFD